MADDSIPTDQPSEDALVTDEAAKSTGDVPPEVKAALRKANKEAETLRLKLKEYEDRDKSDVERQTERVQALEAEAREARTEALRLRVAAKFGIGDEDADLFLTGADEETLTKQAKRLSDRETERKKQGNHVPREGDTSRPAVDERRQFADFLTGNRGT